MKSDDVESYQLHNLSHRSLQDIDNSFPTTVQGKEKLKNDYTLLEKTTHATAVSIGRIKCVCTVLIVLIIILGAGSGYVTYRLFLKMAMHENLIGSLQSELKAKHDPSIRHNTVNIQANRRSVFELSNQFTVFNETFNQFKGSFPSELNAKHDPSIRHNTVNIQANRKSVSELSNQFTGFNETLNQFKVSLQSELNKQYGNSIRHNALSIQANQESSTDLSNQIASLNETFSIFKEKTHKWISRINTKTDWIIDNFLSITETSEQAYADLSTNLKAGTLDTIIVYGRPVNPNAIPTNTSDEWSNAATTSDTPLNSSALPMNSSRFNITSQLELDEERATISNYSRTWVHVTASPLNSDDGLDDFQLFPSFKSNTLQGNPLDLKPENESYPLSVNDFADLSTEPSVNSTSGLTTLPEQLNEEIDAILLNSSGSFMTSQTNAFPNTTSDGSNTTHIDSAEVLIGVTNSLEINLNASLMNTSDAPSIFLENSSSILGDINANVGTAIPSTSTTYRSGTSDDSLYILSNITTNDSNTSASYFSDKSTRLENITTHTESVLSATVGIDLTTGYEISRADQNKRTTMSGIIAPETSIPVTTTDTSVVIGIWADWSQWSQCSVSCGTGQMHRVRTCSELHCEGGKDKDIKQCKTISCPVNGGWSKWNEWSLCSSSCGPGIKYRRRMCNSPSPSVLGKMCDGESSQYDACNDRQCPVNGDWSSWTMWSSCSVTCGQGVKSRTRSCSNPSPESNGQNCTGHATEDTTCETIECPVIGGWSKWNDWSSCSSSCGTGIKYRSRMCNNPSPSILGRMCDGDPSQYEACSNGPCSVDGQWSTWSMWSTCSVTCGTGESTRQRSCNNPSPANDGNICTGVTSETKPCRTIDCPEHGGWSDWVMWSSCSYTCGKGMKRRHRTCSSPKPNQLGDACDGDSSEYALCSVSDCPVDGEWSAWSVWSSCSVSFGSGQMTRLRSCSNPAAANGGLPCSGSNEDHISCNFTPTCPVHGGWSSWGSWSSCKPNGDRFCGGEKTRQRTCTNPTPSYCGEACRGESTETTSCSTFTDIKLIGGPSLKSGTIQLCYQGQIGTVCDDGFDNNDATVACKMLGYKTGEQHQSAFYGQGNGDILLDDLRCTGNETSLFECPHPGIRTHNCGHSEDAGVTCT